MWPTVSSNRLIFTKRSEKYAVFRQQSKEEPLLIYDELLKTPDIEGIIYLKEKSRKSWKKHICVLRSSGLYFVPKGKSKVSPLHQSWSFDTILSLLEGSDLFGEIRERRIILRTRLEEEIQIAEWFLFCFEGEFGNSKRGEARENALVRHSLASIDSKEEFQIHQIHVCRYKTRIRSMDNEHSNRQGKTLDVKWRERENAFVSSLDNSWKSIISSWTKRWVSIDPRVRISEVEGLRERRTSDSCCWRSIRCSVCRSFYDTEWTEAVGSVFFSSSDSVLIDSWSSSTESNTRLNEWQSFAE